MSDGERPSPLGFAERGASGEPGPKGPPGVSMVADPHREALAEAGIRRDDPLYKWSGMMVGAIEGVTGAVTRLAALVAEVRASLDKGEAARLAASDGLGKAIREDAVRAFRGQMGAAIRGTQRRLLAVACGATAVGLVAAYGCGWWMGETYAQGVYGIAGGQLGMMALHGPAELNAWNAVMRLNDLQAAEGRPGACWTQQGGEACSLLLWRTPPGPVAPTAPGR